MSSFNMKPTPFKLYGDEYITLANIYPLLHLYYMYEMINTLQIYYW